MADLTEDQKTIQTLTKEKETLVKQVETLTKEKETLAEQSETIITDLKTKLAEQAAGTVKIPTITVGKETYEFVSDFFYKGEEVTLETLKENSKLAEELVKEGVGNLRKATKKA